MGHKFFRLKLKNKEVIKPFGVTVQTVKGLHSWFVTVHTSTKNRKCDICGQLSIEKGDWYIRSHTPRFEMTGKPATERMCRSCARTYLPMRHIELEVFEKRKLHA